MGVGFDISERKRMEFELQQKRNELAHVTRVSTVGQLASTLAHELNQSLGAILRNAEAAELFLQDPSPDLDELRAIMVDIRRDDQRAGEVIDRMRGLMRQRQAEQRSLDLNLLTKGVIAMVQSDADKRHVRLTQDIDPTLSPVLGDRVQLQQVLINLLLNAFDALDDNQQENHLVTVSARPVNATVEVAVSDNGPGIAADKLLQVFEPFFSSKPSGLGMGLAISRGIIEAHGGQLWVKNNETGGATFTFSLPVVGGNL
jgi:two-component system, LuxR family, sensor kinase FixL